jgi:hypothetical protein
LIDNGLLSLLITYSLYFILLYNTPFPLIYYLSHNFSLYHVSISFFTVSYILHFSIITPTFSSPFLSFLLLSLHHLRLNADAKLPNLQGITVEKIFGPLPTANSVSSSSSSSSTGSSSSNGNGKSYGVSRAANEYYAQTRSTIEVEVEVKREVKALGELLVNDRDPVVAMVKKGKTI